MSLDLYQKLYQDLQRIIQLRIFVVTVSISDSCYLRHTQPILSFYFVLISPRSQDSKAVFLLVCTVNTLLLNVSTSPEWHDWGNGSQAMQASPDWGVVPRSPTSTGACQTLTSYLAKFSASNLVCQGCHLTKALIWARENLKICSWYGNIDIDLLKGINESAGNACFLCNKQIHIPEHKLISPQFLLNK